MSRIELTVRGAGREQRGEGRGGDGGAQRLGKTYPSGRGAQIAAFYGVLDEDHLVADSETCAEAQDQQQREQDGERRARPGQGHSAPGQTRRGGWPECAGPAPGPA